MPFFLFINLHTTPGLFRIFLLHSPQQKKGVPMSGTQDLNSTAQITVNTAHDGQSGIGSDFQTPAPEAEVEENEKELTPSQKEDALLRGNSTGQMKREIEKLRKEAAKYRTSSKAETQQKLEIKAKADEIQKELDALKKEHRNLSLIQKLDRAGCIKSELVAKDIPADIVTAEDLETFIEDYKENNKFLFKAQKQNAGGTFKASGIKNLTPSQKMDAYIRAALGR